MGGFPRRFEAVAATFVHCPVVTTEPAADDDSPPSSTAAGRLIVQPLERSPSSEDVVAREAVERLLAALVATSRRLDAETFVAIVANELPVEGAALVERTPAVQVRAASGTLPSLPSPLLAEAADREAAVARGRTAIVPLGQVSPHAASEPAASGVSPVVLAFDADPNVLPILAAAAGILTLAVQLVAAATNLASAEALLRRSAAWPGTDEAELLHQLAASVCELLDCDRASVFVHDAARHELVAAPALGVAGETLRLPDATGIVGEVLSTGRPERIADAHADPRFNAAVDAEQNYRTHTLLCVPMQSERASPSEGRGEVDDRPLGVIQAINKRRRPFDAADQAMLTLLAVQAAAAIERTQERDRLLRRNESLQALVTSEGAGVGRFVANGPGMRAIRDTIQRLAATDLPVLVLGESGAGKEVCAQALHESGPRARQPFVAVNCAALAETLLESELFGHERGAFTDAHEARAGKFELAHGGTLFLDEVGDMSPGGQAKLLRVLEQKVVTRVGGSTPIPVDVRIIAATNARLLDRIRDDRFREDLYYRLAVVTIDLPPLRDRRDDVLPLAEHFLGVFCRQASREVLPLSPAAEAKLQAHHWPGNVRELRNLMERVAFLATGPRVEPDDLAFMNAPTRETTGNDLPLGLELADATADFQRRYIDAVVERAAHNMTAAASQLGLHRSNLYRKMRQLGMDPAK